MKKHLLLALAVFVTAMLIISSAKRIVSFNSTAQRVEDEEVRLENLRRENEKLKQELEYKKSQRFAEEEIRNKLGMAKEGEEVFVIPQEREDTISEEDQSRKQLPNWRKWQVLIFGEG